MSNAGQGLSAIAGATIGFVITGGSPLGAAYGFQAGLLAGSLLFPTQLPHVFGPRLEDLRTTTAQVGDPIVIPYGTIAVPGTVIWIDCVEEASTSETLGGKGGPEQSNTTYQYYQSIALGLGEGPIAGLLRIWENGELKYDVRPRQSYETEDQFAARLATSAEYAQTFTLHLGTEDQDPDPTIEAVKGVDATPAYLGLAYIVYPRRQLRDDQGRRHPNFRFEIGTGADVIESANGYLFGAGQSGRLEVFTTYPVPTEMTGPTRIYSYIDVTYPSARVCSGPVQAVNSKLAIGYAALYGPAVNTIRIDRFDVTEPDDPDIDPPVVTRTTVGTLTLAALAPASSTYIMGALVRDQDDDALVIDFLDDDLITHIVKVDPDTAAVIWHTQSASDLDPVNYAKNHASNEQIVDGKIYRLVTAGGFAQAATIDATDGTYTLTRVDSGAVTNGLPSLFGPWGANGATKQILISHPSVGPRLIDLSGVSPVITTVTYLAGAALAQADSQEIVIDWQGGYFYLVDVSGAHSGSLDDRGVRKFRISDVTEVAQIAATELGVSQFTAVYGFVFADDDLWITLVSATNVVRLLRLDGDTLALKSSQVVATASTPALYDLWFNNVGLRTEYSTTTADPQPVSIADIIRDVATRVGVDPTDDIDVVDLEDKLVLGYAVTRPMPGRGAIEPLRQVGFFDSVESMGILKFPTRGKAIVATLVETDLGAHMDGESAPPLVTTKKAQDVDLPRRIWLRYISPARDYEPGQQSSPSRNSGQSVNEPVIDVPIAISGTLAKRAAETLWVDSWAGRYEHATAIDASFSRLDAADCVDLPVDGRLYRCRIEAFDDTAGLIRKLQLRRDDALASVSTAIAADPQLPPPQIILRGPSVLVLLDLPALRDEDDDAGIYAAAYRENPARTWTGVVIHRSVDDGATFAQVGSIMTEAVIGELVDAAQAGPSTIWDGVNVLTVQMLAGAFESRSTGAVLAGANAVAVGAPGRWEILQFAQAELIGANIYRLSALLRGRRGTEHVMGTSEAGDQVVLLSAGGIARLPLQTSEIGATRIYRAVSIGTSVAAAEDLEFAGAGLALETFSPVHIAGAWQDNGDLLITWIRRGRLGQELRDGADIPLSEETEAYEVDILEAGSPQPVLRTLTSTVQHVTYTAAQIASDGYSPGDAIPIRVYQLSAVVGRGTPGEITL